MAVFRVERNKGYTVMSNHHLRNKELTLKAKGLLLQMLSLPEDWDYTLAGMSQINRESIDAIRTAIWELEKAGYIKRQQGRDAKGKMTAIEYTIYEQPQPPDDLTILPPAFVRSILTAKPSALVRPAAGRFCGGSAPAPLASPKEQDKGRSVPGGRRDEWQNRFIEVRPYLKTLRFFVSNLPRYRCWRQSHPRY